MRFLVSSSRPLALALSLAVSFSLVACKSETSKLTEPSPKGSASAAAKMVPPSTNLPDLDTLLALDGGAMENAATAGAGAGAGAAAPGDPNPGAAAAPGAGGPAGQPGQPGKPTKISVKLVEPGAEPRTPARYDFAMDKPQTTLATVKMTAVGAPAGMGQQPPIRLTLRVTPKAKSAEGNTKFVMDITKAEIMTGGTPVPPEAQKEIKAAEAQLAKLSGTFTANNRGALSDVSFGGQGAPPEAEELILPMLELLFAPLPEEPIGVGAKWTMSTAADADASMKSTFTMTARTPSTADVTVESQRTASPHPIPDPRAPPGATMAMDGKGKTQMQVRFGGIAGKVEGDSKTSITIKDPSQNPPRTATNSIQVHHTLEPK